jgi:hypothetical protein
LNRLDFYHFTLENIRTRIADIIGREAQAA